MSLNTPVLCPGLKDSLKRDAFSFLTKTDKISTPSVAFRLVKMIRVLHFAGSLLPRKCFVFRCLKQKHALNKIREVVYHSAQVQALARAAPQKDKRAERRDLLYFQLHDLWWKNERGG